MEKRLKVVGEYGLNWFSGYRSILPKYCRKSDLNEKDKSALLKYLNSWPDIGIELGSSKFSIKWAMCDCHMSQSRFTDGVYFWSSRLVSNIEEYNVKLPSKFVEHALKGKKNDFANLKEYEVEDFSTLDASLWKEWCDQEYKQMSLLDRFSNGFRMLVFALNS